MKTFEEIKEHLKEHYYNGQDIIRVFLAREGLNEKEIESLKFKFNPLGFKDFIKWYDSENPSKIIKGDGWKYFIKKDAGDTNKKYKISGEERELLEKEYSTLTEMLKTYERIRDESKDPFLKQVCTDLVELITDGIKLAESELNETVD